MCSMDMRDAHEQAGRRKAYAKALLDVIIEADEAESNDQTVEFTPPGGPAQHWKETRCQFCKGSLRPFKIQAPDDATKDGTTAHYCPGCWYLTLFGKNGDVIAGASRQTTKSLRRIPPGTKIVSVRIGDKTIHFDPPRVVKGEE